MVANDKVAPIKERRAKHNSQELFEGEISEAIKNHDYRKLLKKKKKFQITYQYGNIYDADRYKVHKLIFDKKKDHFENKLNECIGTPSYGKP